MKARPGPGWMTSIIGRLISFAMYPIKEKMTNPQKKLVPAQVRAIRRAFLEEIKIVMILYISLEISVTL